MAITAKYRKDIISSLVGTASTGSGNNTSFTLPFGGTARYVGLSFTKPSMTGENITEPWPVDDSEANANGYSRALIAQHGQSATIKFGPTTDTGEAENIDHIYFSEATKPWEDRNPQKEIEPGLKYFVIFNSGSQTSGAGSVLAYAPLTDENGTESPIVVSAGNTVVLFRKGDLKVKYVDIYEE